MSEYSQVERPFLDQLSGLGWTVVDQGVGVIPSDPAKSLRTSFREWLSPEHPHHGRWLCVIPVTRYS